MTGNSPGAADYPGIEGDGERPIPDGHEFALLLTHDVDRPYKTYQSAYYAVTDPEKRRYHLSTLLPGVNPYWQFENVMAVERDLGVRSAFYFLSEQRLRDRPIRDWLSKDGWQLFAGRYSLSDPRIRGVAGALASNGWEVGLHGSFESFRDRDRLRTEKAAVERVLADDVVGGRQHYLNLDVPETWRHHHEVGLRYDSSLGSSDEYGFQHGYGVHRPFDDEFVVFPLTMMEQALPDPGDDYDAARAACEDVLAEARRNDAVASVLWHPRHFSHRDFPGYLRLYRELVERALDFGAWVGSPAEFYETAGLGDVPGDSSDGSSEPVVDAPGEPSDAASVDATGDSSVDAGG